jgi:hypothetical protein
MNKYISLPHALILAAIIALAAVFRLTGMNWDSKSHLHPDERFLTMVATEITLPHSLQNYLDTRTSPANPHNKKFSFYVYGTYPMHITKLIATISHNNTYDGITIVGRVLSVIVDLITLLLVFLIASHLTKKQSIGLLAAFCYAASVLPIQLSHFFTVDPYITLFTTMALWQILRHRMGFLLGVTAALAISAKISSVLIIPVIGISFLALWPWSGQSKDIWKTRKELLVKALWCIVGLFLTLRLAYPYLFVGLSINPLLLANWRQLASFNEPTTSFPPGLQWVSVLPIQPTLDLFVWGVGIPLTLLAIFALTYTTRKHIKKRTLPEATPLILWIALVLGYQSLQFAKPMRYFWPIYPSLAVFSGIALWYVYTFLVKRLQHRLIRFGVFFIMLMILLLWPISFLSIYTKSHTRIRASAWIYQHIPEGQTIAWEHWDDPLPFPMEGFPAPSIYKQIQLPSFDPDDEKKSEKIMTVLGETDYVVLSSNRAYGALWQTKERFPFMSDFYSRLFSGNLGFELVAQFTSRPTIPFPWNNICLYVPGFRYGIVSRMLEECDAGGISIIDDYADETFTVYDHPKVLIFKKVK